MRRSRTFYEQALEPFGVKVVESSLGRWVRHRGRWRFLDREGSLRPLPFMWPSPQPTELPSTSSTAPLSKPAAVDTGAPGLRPQYHAGYYAAVRHRPGREQRRSGLPRGRPLAAGRVTLAWAGVLSPTSLGGPAALSTTDASRLPRRWLACVALDAAPGTRSSARIGSKSLSSAASERNDSLRSIASRPLPDRVVCPTGEALEHARF